MSTSHDHISRLAEHRKEYDLIDRLRGRAFIPGMHFATQAEYWMREAANEIVHLRRQQQEYQSELASRGLPPETRVATLVHHHRANAEMVGYIHGSTDALENGDRWKAQAVPLLDLLERCHGLLPEDAQAPLGTSKPDAVERFLKSLREEA